MDGATREFQPTLPRGERLDQYNPTRYSFGFQPTLPRGERQQNCTFFLYLPKSNSAISPNKSNNLFKQYRFFNTKPLYKYDFRCESPRMIMYTSHSHRSTIESTRHRPLFPSRPQCSPLLFGTCFPNNRTLNYPPPHQ